MSRYAEENLNNGEMIIKKAELNGLSLIPKWIAGVLLRFLLFIPTIKAIIATVQFFNQELAITNKRIIGKTGVLNTDSLDSPLNKIQNVSAEQSFWGKIFNYSEIRITTAAGDYRWTSVKNGNAFKKAVMAQIDQYEEDHIKQQAMEMAKSMASVINN